MVLRINQLRAEVLAVRNQREATNAVHRDQEMRYHRRIELLQNKINLIQKRGVGLHKAKAALDHIYNDDGSSAKNLPLQVVVRRQALLVSALRNIHALESAKKEAEERMEGIRLVMTCELFAIKDEKIDLCETFNRQRTMLFVETKAMADKYDTYLHLQHLMLDKLDPSRSMSKMGLFFGILVPTGSMSKLLYEVVSPMSLLKSTYDIVQMVPRTA